ncbi:DUF2637 domain-containing protein [Nocardia anaemiae]|uniref:DUF2637 domain-containing protein n=1 Tax=Nocardia anaemiae TaxID=263910 RepID=UPI0007A50591|nr:DUF2637 domain-containing protein [Nocardia anaemiae]
MATITSAESELLEEQSTPADGRPSLISRLRAWRPRPLHASAIVTGVVALTSFEMSFAALHDLSVRNLVAPALAANVPIAIDGLVIGSIIATATFKRHSSAWWYATALFVFWTLVSVAGNIEYAREIGGSPVSLSLYAGMPLTMLFAVHLTLMLFGRGRDRARAAESAAAPQENHAPATQENRAPETQEARDQAAERDWATAVEEDWDDAAGDWDSAPHEERVVTPRGAAILENTDPLPVAPKKLLTSTLPGTAALPRITPTYATTGVGGKTKINPL